LNEINWKKKIIRMMRRRIVRKYTDECHKQENTYIRKKTNGSRWRGYKGVEVLREIQNIRKRGRKRFSGFEFPMAVVTKKYIFWNIMPCCQLKVNRCFGGTYCLLLHG
jgi:hypothetical protein